LIKFVTLFLGLVVGAQPVTVAPPSDAATVELWLDGALVDTLDSPPWTFSCDFGEELAPHRLEAVARDEDGGELARAEQIVNLPRPPAEAEILLENEGEVLVARVVFDTVGSPGAPAVHWELDGQPLAVEDPERIVLPGIDRSEPHLLKVELVFGSGIRATSVVAFGGGLVESSEIELQSLTVLLGEGMSELRPEHLEGRIRAESGPLPVVAVEKGAADVILVPGEVALDDTHELATRLSRRLTVGGLRTVAPLGPDQEIRIVVPRPRRRVRAGVAHDGFDVSPPVGAHRPGLLARLDRFEEVEPDSEEDQRIADAVAVAGLAATERSRRRAVVLLLGDEAPDASDRRPGEVRRFLARLGVPLVVWRTSDSAASASTSVWGEGEFVGRMGALEDAVRRLRRDLDRQRVVWVHGAFLPGEVVLGAPGIYWAGADAAFEDIRRAEPASGESDVEVAATEPETASGAASHLVEPAPVPEPAEGASPPTGAPSPPVETEDPAATGRAYVIDEGGGGGMPFFGEILDVELAEVEVFVTGPDGEPVAGLGTDDFALWVGGERREIVSVFAGPGLGSQVPGEEGRKLASVGAEAGEKRAPASFVVLIDEAHLLPGDRSRVLGRLESYLQERTGAGDRVMLVAFDEDLRIERRFDASDPLAEDLDRLGRTSTGAIHALSEKRGTLERIRNLHREDGCGALAQMISAAELWAQMVEHDVLRALSAVGALVEKLGGVPGPKTLLFAASDLPLSPGLEAYLLVDRLCGSRTATQVVRPLLGDLDRVVKRANASRVVFYTIDAGGQRVLGADVSAAGPGLDAAGFATLTADTQDPLHGLAAATGGRALLGSNRLDEFLEDLDRDLGSFYSLAFVPGEEEPDRRQELRIEVRRPRIRVRHRETWQPVDDFRRLEALVEASSSFGGEVGNELGVRLLRGEARPVGEGHYILPLRLLLPVDRLVLLPSEELLRGRIELVIVARGDRGDSSPVRRLPVAVEVPATGSEGAWIPVDFEIRLGSGRSAIDLLVRDLVGRGESGLRHVVEVSSG